MPIVLWAAVGCCPKIIDRLDCANYQLDQITQQLCQANQKLEDAKKKLDEGNKIARDNGGKLDTANMHHEGTNARLDEANKELIAIEKEIKGASSKLDKLDLLDMNLSKIEKNTGSIDGKVTKYGDSMQKNFEELIKRSPPPKP
jgi:chromosome segregation ATPase